MPSGCYQSVGFVSWYDAEDWRDPVSAPQSDDTRSSNSNSVSNDALGISDLLAVSRSYSLKVSLYLSRLAAQPVSGFALGQDSGLRRAGSGPSRHAYVPRVGWRDRSAESGSRSVDEDE